MDRSQVRITNLLSDDYLVINNSRTTYLRFVKHSGKKAASVTRHNRKLRRRTLCPHPPPRQSGYDLPLCRWRACVGSTFNNTHDPYKEEKYNAKNKNGASHCANRRSSRSITLGPERRSQGS